MRRVIVMLALLALVLAGCGGSSADTTVGDPPKATAFEKAGSAQLDKIVADWKTQVPAQLLDRQVKQELIEQKVYQSTASLQEIADYYHGLTTTKGWVEVQHMPDLQSGFFASGYDLGTTHLVVGAVDASKFGGSGVIVYTAKGTK